jgi:hypothetical protein
MQGVINQPSFTCRKGPDTPALEFAETAHLAIVGTASPSLDMRSIMPSKSRTRIFRDPDEAGGNELTAFGVGDKVQCGITNRMGFIQMAYIDNRSVMYSVEWDDGSKSSKKAAEIRLIHRKP